MPTLEWIGKDKVINHHQQVPYRVLEERYTFGAEKSENMIIRGDNLEALKALLPKYEGRIKCIYIDPPYNTGNENWVYNDNVNDPKIKKWLGQVVGKEGEDLSRHDKWLCMMYPRLKLLQKLLSSEGLIFISIADNEFAALRMLCDEIFGYQNFKACLTWKSRAKPSNTGDAKYAPQNDAEYVLCFGKNSRTSFIPVFSGRERSYPHHDRDGNYRLQTILKSNRGESKRDTMCFSLNGYTPPPTKRWQAGKDTIRELWQNNRITFETGEPMLKYYQHEEKNEVAPFYCYIDKEISSTAENGKKELNAILGNQHGFDTVKPIEIIVYLLQHSTEANDIILDSFAGSGTTAHAVLNMNKADGGNRKFILVEMEDYAESITAERVKRVIIGYGEGKNAAEGTGGDFTFYDLGQALLLPNGNLNEDVDIAKIRDYVWFMETRSPLAPAQSANPYFLGSYNSTDYYFYYEKDQPTTLNHGFLSTIKEKADGYLIYADLCTIPDEELKKYNITFKKIPRDIKRL